MKLLYAFNLIDESKKSVVKVGNSQIEYEHTHRGHAENKFKVKLAKGDWPSDIDIICALGGNKVFKGKVNKNGDEAAVTVYVD